MMDGNVFCHLQKVIKWGMRLQIGKILRIKACSERSKHLPLWILTRVLVTCGLNVSGPALALMYSSNLLRTNISVWWLCGSDSYQPQFNSIKNTSTISVYTLIWVQSCYGYSGCNNISSVFVFTFAVLCLFYYYYFPSCHAQVNSSGKVTCSKFNRQLIESQEQNNIQIEQR